MADLAGIPLLSFNTQIIYRYDPIIPYGRSNPIASICWDMRRMGKDAAPAFL